MTPLVLHLSPHPDDELIGAPATLMALRDAGWRVVNLACGLGGRGQRERREAELREACVRAGFELRLGDPAAPRRAIAAAIDELAPDLVVSPCPQDRHPSHVRIARAAVAALEERGEAAPRWWAWALWGALPRPTLACGFEQPRLEEILAALAAHRGELVRNDYRRLVRGRAEAAACLAPELLFGFGTAAAGAPPYAELLSELVWSDGAWRLGSARWLDPSDPPPPPTPLAATALAHVAFPVDGDLQVLVAGEEEVGPGEGEEG
ncbi:MAG TPA: PIG-L family deacetylase [Solirubrobacterales bacterium]